MAVTLAHRTDLSTLETSAGALRAALVALDVSVCTGEQAGRLVETLAVLEKVVVAARLRAAARMQECGAYRRDGFRSAAEFLAARTGTARQAAAAALDAAREISRHPEVAGAFGRGDLSEAQAIHVAPAVAADPTAAADLLSVAGRGSLRQLKDKARAVRLATLHRDDLYRRQRRLREHRHWIDGDGMVAGRYRLPPDTGAIFAARIDAEVDRRYRAATKDTREPAAAYAADALTDLVIDAGTDPDTGDLPNGDSPGGGRRPRGKGRRRARPRVDAIVVVDLGPVRRGHTHEGERCHIVGVGPIPVAVARQMMADAFLKAAVIDGTEILKIRHFSRYRPAELQTALDLGPAPELNGAVCTEGCGRRMGLQWDHLDPLANGGPTELRNLGPKCVPDHIKKTERDRAAGLLNRGRRRPRPPSPAAGNGALTQQPP